MATYLQCCSGYCKGAIGESSNSGISSKFLLKTISCSSMHGGNAGDTEYRWRVGRGERSHSAEREGKSGMWLDGILGKVCSSPSHSQDLSWGQIPHGAERKPAGVCRATSTRECFTSNGKCSQPLARLSLSLYFSISVSPSLPNCVRCLLLCLALHLSACDKQYF